MPYLSDKQVDEVHDVLVNRGVTLESLKLDLLDHICCQVEELLDNGTSFNEALNLAEKQFGPLGIEATQEATVFFLTLKSRKMKKITSIIGIVGGIITMFATLFKIMHWPGAGILLTVGIATISLFYLPMSLITNLREKENTRDKLTVIGGFVAGSLLSLSALFKIMYWPGNTKLFVVGLLFLLLIYTPLQFIKSYRSADNKLFNISGFLVIVAGVALFFGLYRANGTSSYYLAMTENIQKESMDTYFNLQNEVNHETQVLKTQNPDAYEKALQIERVSNKVFASIQQYRMDLIREDLKHLNSSEQEQMDDLEDLESYTTLQAFKTSFKAFDHRNTLDRSQSLHSLLLDYQKLVSDIVGSDQISTDSFQESLRALKSLPDYKAGDTEIQMFTISCVNLCEARMKALQHQMVKEVL